MADVKPDIQAIFFAAVELGSLEQISEYLDAACGNDRELRAEVEALLSSHREAGKFLGGSASASEATIDQPVTEKPGTQIGPYKLLQQIGEGGMGVVYMAEQKEPVKRRVALKIIKPGMDTRQVIARFEAERQALAMMDHPNIAKVLDAGATDSGRPYFVMELVNGISVTQYCDEQHLTPKERLELFLPICQAVQHAHQKGIIHRDLKPSNVMIALYDDRAVPKVIDFGVAKATSQTLTEKTMFTQLGQIVGTMEYMSPEQAQRNQLDIDTRSDIYSLGVLLYELLTGDTPFDRQRLRSAAFDEMLRIIREEEPLKPSTKVSGSESLASIAANRKIDPAKLSVLVRGELDWIVMKALEKDRGRRYATATNFAEDIQRYLNDEAVVACPPSAQYRFRKFARRNSAALVTATAVSLALLGGTLISSWQAIRAIKAGQLAEEGFGREQTARREAEAARRQTEQQRNRAVLAESVAGKEAANAKRAAEQERKLRDQADRLRVSAEASEQRAESRERLARRLLYAADMRLAQQAHEQGHFPHMQQLLDRHIPADDKADYRAFDWYYLWQLCHNERFTRGYSNHVHSVAFSPDGKLLAATADGVQIIDPATGERLHTLLGHRRTSRCVAFSPNGKLLASADGGFSGAGEVKLWDTTTWKNVKTLRGHNLGVLDIAFSPDGQLLASASGGSYDNPAAAGTVKLWDIQTGREQATYRKHTKGVTAVAFSPDGTELVSGGWDGRAFVWSVAKSAPPTSLPLEINNVNGLAVSKEGKLALVKGDRLEIWDLAQRQRLLSREIHGGFSVAFSADGKRVATAGASTVVEIWDAETGESIDVLRGATQWIWSVAFSPDGAAIASGDRGRRLKVWELSRQDKAQVLVTHERKPTYRSGERKHVLFSADGQWLAKLDEDNRVALLEASTLRPSDELELSSGRPQQFVVAANGKRAACISDRGELFVWALPNLKLLSQAKVAREQINALAMTSDGRIVATASENRTVCLWNTENGERIAQLVDFAAAVSCLAFSPDQKLLATGLTSASQRVGRAKQSNFGEVKIFDWQRGEVKQTYRSMDELLLVKSLAFAPAGDRLVVGGGSHFNPLNVGKVAILEVASGEEQVVLEGHSATIRAVAFTQRGEVLATAADDGHVKLWDTETWQERLDIAWEGHAIDCLSFDQHGSRLLAGATDGAVKLWRTADESDVAKYREQARSEAWAEWSQRAREHMSIGQWQRAIDDFSKAIELNPNDATLWSARGVSHARLKEHELAIADYAKAIELEPNKSDYWANRGYSNLVQKSYAEAQADYSRAIELRPNHAPWCRYRGRVFLEQENWDKAIADFQKAVQLDPRSSRAWEDWNHACNRAQRWEQVEKQATERIEQDASDWIGWHQRGISRGGLNRWGEAIEDFSAAISRVSDNWRPLNRRGVAYFRQARWQEACDDFSAAMLVDPEEITPWRNRANCHVMLEQYTLAADDFAAAVSVGAYEAVDEYYVALTHLTSGNLPSYRKSCRRLLRVFGHQADPAAVNFAVWSCVLGPAATTDSTAPLDAASRILRPESASNIRLSHAAALYRADRFQQATNLLETLESQTAEDPKVFENLFPAYRWFFLAMAHEQAGNHTRAEQFLAKGVAWTDRVQQQQSLESAETLSWNRRLTLTLLQREAEAVVRESLTSVSYYDRYSKETLGQRRSERLTLLNRRIQRSPKDWDALRARGALFHEAERWQEAIADYTVVLENTPQDAPFTFFSRAWCYEHAKMYDAALADLDRAIEIDPDYSSPYRRRAHIRIRVLQQFHEGIADCENALRIDSRDVTSILRRAQAYRFLGDFESALGDVIRAIKIENSREWAWEELPRIALAARSYDQLSALDELYRYIEKDPQTLSKRAEILAEIYQRRAKLYADQGDAVRALSDGEVVSRLLGNSPEPLERLGEEFFVRGHWQDTLRAHKRALDLGSEDPLTIQRIATSLIAMGDHEAYRDHCRAMLSRYAETEDPGIAVAVAQCFTYDSWPKPDLEKPLLLARLGAENPKCPAWGQHRYGLLLYRTEAYEEARQQLADVLAQQADQPHGNVLFVLAMTEHVLGNNDKAGELFLQGEKWLEENDHRTTPVAKQLGSEAKQLLAEGSDVLENKQANSDKIK